MSGRTIGFMGMLALVLGASLLVVPPALAESPQDYPSVTATRVSVRPDDLPGLRGPGVTATRVSVRPDDLPGLRGPGVVATAPTVFATDAGFDWADAAIGGAVALGVVVLTGLAVWTARRHGPTTGRHAPT